MLEQFRTEAAEAHLTLFEVYGMFIEASPAPVDRPLRGGPAARRRGSGGRRALARGQRRGRLRRLRYRMALDHGRLAALVPEIERVVAAQAACARGRSRCLRSLDRGRPPDDADGLLGDVRRHRTASLIGDNQMFLPAACTLGRGRRARSTTPSGASVLQATLTPYAGRVAVAGLAGLLRRAGQRLRRAGGTRRRRPRLAPSGTCARPSTRTSPTARGPTRPAPDLDLALTLLGSLADPATTPRRPSAARRGPPHRRRDRARPDLPRLDPRLHGTGGFRPQGAQQTLGAPNPRVSAPRSGRRRERRCVRRADAARRATRRRRRRTETSPRRRSAPR